MGIEAKQDALCSIKKFLRCSVRTTWRCAYEYWALFGLLLLLYLMYKYSPGFFAFLLSTSPVIICTSLLLGVLLNYGGAHLPEKNAGGKTPEGISAPKVESSSRNVDNKAEQEFSVLASKENITRETSFGRRDSNKCTDLDESVPLLKGADEQNERVDDDAGGRPDKMLTSVRSIGGLKTYAEKEYKVREDAETEANPDYEGRVCTDSPSGEVVDVSEHNVVDGAAGKRRWGRAFSVRQRKKLADIKIEAIDSVADNQLEHSLLSPLARVGSHDSSSGFNPDNAESHSPGVSMIDTGAVLNESEPLLGGDSSCPDCITNDDSDNHSSVISHVSQADSGSNDVADNSKAKDDGEDKKDAGTEPGFLWTADEEKNVMDLGYSEMERNRRLETLMVRRKSRKNIIFELDDMGGMTDDLSRFHSQLQHISISARQMNPFADDAEIPGSAPPILHPQKSPFDFLTEQSTESGVPACHDLEPTAVSHQDSVFKRHESFNIGRPPQRHGSRFKSSLAPGEFSFDEAGASSFQRQFSDRSVSRLSVVSECDTVSSVGDQEHNDLIRNYIRSVRESPSLPRQDSDLVYAGNECSDGISFVDSETLNTVIC